MKFCPFLVAGQSLQASQPRAGAIPGSQQLILPTREEPSAPAVEGSGAGSTWVDFGAGATIGDSWTEPASGLRFGDEAKVGAETPGTEAVGATVETSRTEAVGPVAETASSQEPGAPSVAPALSSMECLGEPCRFFHAGGCRFDALFDSRETQAVAARAGVVTGTNGDAASQVETAVASAPGMLDEVWSLQRESLREVMGGFRNLEAAFSELRTGMASQLESQAQVLAQAQAVPPQVELVEQVTTRFETLEREIRTVETVLRDHVVDSTAKLRTALEESQADMRDSLSRTEAHLKGVVEKSQATVAAALGGTEAVVRSSLVETQSALRATVGETQAVMRSSLGAVQNAVRDSVGDVHTTVRASIGDVQSSVRDSIGEVQSTLGASMGEVQAQLGSLVARASAETRAQLERGLLKLAEEIRLVHEVRAQLQTGLDTLSREAREVATAAKRIESSQSLTQQLVEEQRQQTAKVDARENRERARQMNNAGVMSYHQGAYDASVDRFKQAIDLDPTLAEAYNNLGLSYTEMGRDEEATAAFQRALETDPSVGQVYNNLGYLYYRRGDLSHAVEMYQRAIQRGSDTSAAYSNLANAYYKMKRFDEAVSAWRRAVEIDPSNHRAAAALERLGLETRQA
jgi:tetratricopeptide (TPR) repeat protein